MRGSTENDDATIASYLAKEINGLNLNTCWSVVNYGENSYNSLMEVQYLQKELIQNDYQPDIVLFYDGANDCVYFAQHRTAEGHHGYRRAKGLIESYYKSFFGVFKALNAAYYASFTKELHDKLMQVQIDINPSSPEFQEHVKQVGETLHLCESHLRLLRRTFYLLFWQPAQWVENQEVMVEVREKESRHFINTERFASMRNNFPHHLRSLGAQPDGPALFLWIFATCSLHAKPWATCRTAFISLILAVNWWRGACLQVLLQRGLL